ncbi:metallo-beta-lactamase family protein (plasmid) [Peptoclostridium acidaminophilum DSM 3953]|uniref:Metallo-beta-lactamase family protein n=1 Tax=Peptoclostridium acidaminophilum DSM 3953 TaxID=1286171 RepID=W8T813_PEPAC|nr:MBL fold metallo-hydrolase [Peptoclostridium acidaminophilum]AHM57864.1 metallo-beta-lactamase family protein [Peptoclostridium acidaminophilum DSM 3953]
MIIKTLAENTAVSTEFRTEHGLSLYIETNRHKLLFDLGASDLFIENAQKMDVDITQVDTVFISHGHYDHGGGLKAFLNANSRAKVYVNKRAFENHYANREGGKRAYIGLDKDIMESDRLIFVGDQLRLDEELELFSNVKGRKFYPSGNVDLLLKQDEQFILDDFAHEQNLIISEEGKRVLIAGCAHNGIVNIIEHMKEYMHEEPTHVIGGFHLHNRSAGKSESQETVGEIGRHLKNTGAQYYTCHCTGIEAYGWLRDVMDGQIEYLATGSQLKL